MSTNDDRTLAGGVIESITYMSGRPPRPQSDLDGFGRLLLGIVAVASGLAMTICAMALLLRLSMLVAGV